MKLYLFGVKDNVTGETGFIFPARNEKDMRRTVKSAIASKSQIFTDNIADKQIFTHGEFETSTGQMVGLPSPVFTDSVQSIVDELVLEIKAHNQKMKDAGLPEVDSIDDGKEQ